MQRFACVWVWVCIDDVNKSFLPVDFGGGGSGSGGGVNVIGLGDNSTEWNIIGILFTNEKVACVDTENNELNQVLSYKKIIRVYGEAYKQKSVFSTVLFEVNSIFWEQSSIATHSLSGWIVETQSSQSVSMCSHVDFSIHQMHSILFLHECTTNRVVVQRVICM